jgi:Fe-S cluster assembly protein SufD
MSALLDSLLQGYDALPSREAAGLGPARRAALEAVRADGLPAARAEAWKYTSLRALERRAFAPSTVAPAFAADAFVLPPAPRLVFVNGLFDAARSDLSGLPEGVTLQPLSQRLADGDPRAVEFLARRFAERGEGFARLNAALAGEGCMLEAAPGAVSEVPIHLLLVGAADADRAWHLRHLISLREGARLLLVEQRLAVGAHAHLANELAHVHLARGAQLVHARLQTESDAATALLRTDAVLASDSRYTRVDLELGGALSRHELNVALQGERATLVANGVLFASGRRHLDTRLGIEHIARDTRCDLSWRGLGAGRGRAVFHGGIEIRAGADGSAAQLSNKNLLLSEGAEIDTQPVLEIHADEVQAAHGATVGRLDANALFYLRSRGLPETQARALLTAAFCREVLAVLGDASLREMLAQRLDAALATLEAA